MTNLHGCGTCIFWINQDQGTGVGLCRRYPPSVLLLGIQQMTGQQPAAQTQSAFPPMTADGWCGEHSPKPQITQ